MENLNLFENEDFDISDNVKRELDIRVQN